MGVSVGRQKTRKAQKVEHKRLTEVAQAQARKSKKRKGFLGKVSGFLGGGLGTLLGGVLGVASGGLLMPLIMGATTLATRKGLDIATKRGALGRELMGADPRELKKATARYGFYDEARQDIANDLAKADKSVALTWKNLGTNVAAAGLGQALGGLTKDLGKIFKEKGFKGITEKFKGDLFGKGAGKTWLGSSGEGVVGTGSGLIGGGWKGAEEALKKMWSGATVGDIAKDKAIGLAKQYDPTKGIITNYASDPTSLGRQFEVGNIASTFGVGGDYSKQVGQVLDKTKVGDKNIFEMFSQQEEPSPLLPKAEQGGQVQGKGGQSQGKGGGIPMSPPPQINPLYDILMAQQQQNTQKDEVQSSTPTIAEFFQTQGKTPGGNNNKTLSQLMG